MQSYQTTPGSRQPLGASLSSAGANFSIVSPDATRVELLLYEHHDSQAPFQVIELDPEVNRTFMCWHVFVKKLKAGIHYTWRVDGPSDPYLTGKRFDPSIELLDPWAKAVSDSRWNRTAAMRGEKNGSMRAIVVKTKVGSGDREERRRRRIRKGAFRSQDAIIYEMHVGGFTLHPSSGVAPEKRGTFAGVIEKIPYLKSLGITHVELLPVMAFDRQDVPAGVAKRGLSNYWGYSTHSYYSPHLHYCISPERGTHLDEFREMVDALHEANIEVILDVVFNHTAEAGENGPVINFKGLNNDVTYHLDPDEPSRYRDFTGCGNTVNCNNPVVSNFLVSCLEFWVNELHVDGFRFDLASVLSRGEDGEPMASPPIIWAIELSPVLSTKRIIAEAWDAVGLYQVGNFPGYRWSEWNGRYRDVVRRFVRGDPGILGEVATRISGSSDYYRHQGRHPFNSINFVTCHDGFTLWDLVSFNHKHNQPNGEHNRDGHNDNLSWNCGVEGQTEDAEILALRRLQVKNFMAILMLSQGLPMILAGDEVLRSQQGNNNAWCQDNEVGWFNWELTEQNREMLRFTRGMIALRKRHPSLKRRQFLTGVPAAASELADITWHGKKFGQPAWDDPVSRVLGFTLAAVAPDEAHLHVIMNMSERRQRFSLPATPDISWRLAVDTAAAAPDDIPDPDQQPYLTRAEFEVEAHSLVVLEGEDCGNGCTD
jgi:glycogen operon protein